MTEISGVKEYYDQEAKRYDENFYRKTSDYPPLIYRHHYMLNMIKSISLPINSKILDVGCGPGEMVADLVKIGFEVWGTDISPEMISIAKDRMKEYQLDVSKYHLSTGDIEKVEFPDKIFDAIICSGVVEYLPTDTIWPGELIRILKPGGYLSINVTNRHAVRRWTMGMMQSMKNSKMLFGMMNFVKEKILRRGKLNQFPFRPRVHSPATFDAFMAEKGFEKISHNYFDFSLLPWPFDTVFGFITIPIRKKMEHKSHLDCKRTGTGYIALYRLKTS